MFEVWVCSLLVLLVYDRGGKLAAVDDGASTPTKFYIG